MPFPLPELIPTGLGGALPPPGGLTPPLVSAQAVCSCCDCNPGQRPGIIITVTNLTSFNLVGPQDGSFESSTGSAVPTDCLISSSSEESLDGVRSLKMQFNSTVDTAMSVKLGPYSVVAGVEYSFTANLRGEQFNRAVSVMIQFVDSGNNVLLTQSATGLDSDLAWMTPALWGTVTAPSGAVNAYLIVSETGLTPALPPPSPLTVTPQGAAGTTAYGYKATALNTLGESTASGQFVTTTGNATLSGTNFNRITYAAVSGATGYNIYRGAAPTCAELAAAFATCALVETSFATCLDLVDNFFGNFLLIGTTAGLTFNDTGLAANPPGPPGLNSTGESHYLDELGLFQGNIRTWSNIPPGFAVVRRPDGTFVIGAGPLDPLTFADGNTVEITDWTAPYGLPISYTAVLVAGGVSSPPSVPSLIVTMGQAPDTCELWGRLGWPKDEDKDMLLLKWIAGIGQMIQAVDTISGDQFLPDGSVSPGWSQVLDIERCPTEALPWLGQFVGARMPPSLRDDQMRYTIENSPAWARGTVGAIEAAANLNLISGFSISIAERTPDPYSLTITIPRAGIVGGGTCLALSLMFAHCSVVPTVYPTCADLWATTDAIETAIASAIPAGLVTTIAFD
jgi:hypothetical protein